MKKKIFSVLVAVCVAILGLGVPTFAKGYAKAVGTMETLSVKRTLEGKQFEIGEEVNFAEFLYSTTDVEVLLWSPNGTKIEGVTASGQYRFESAGIYALQYKLNGATCDIYSDQYLLPVSNNIDQIELKQTVSSKAKTGSRVVIPQPVDNNVAISVYSSYGKEVEVGSSAGKSYFTNLENCKGNYYIQYVLHNDVLNEDMYRYIVVEFGDDYQEAQTTELNNGQDYSFELFGDVKDILKDNAFYLFREYDLTNVRLIDKKGKEVADAEIRVSLKKVGTGMVVAESVLGLQKYEITDLDGITELGMHGPQYIITYIARIDEEIVAEKTVSAESWFNAEAISFEADGLVPDVIIFEQEDSFQLPTYSYKIDSRYTKASYDALFAGKELKITVKYDEDTKTLALTGDRKIDASVSGYDTILSGDTTSKDLKIVYSLDYVHPTVESFSGTLKKELKSRLAKSGNDDQQPQDVVVENFAGVVYSDSFVIPKVTANDFDNAGNKTNGVWVTVTLNGNPVAGGVGSTVELVSGINAIEYTITDSSNNSRIRTIYVKYIASISDYNDSDIEWSSNEGEYTITSGDVYGVTIYTNNSEPQSPMSVTYENGKIKSFKIDSQLTDFIAVFGANTDTDRVYRAKRIGTGDIVVKPYSIGYKVDGASYNFAPNGIQTARVGDSVVINNVVDFSVETENGLFKSVGGNVFTLLKPAKYIFIVNEKRFEVTASEFAVASPEFMLTSQKVVSGKEVGGREVELKVPYVSNYFGYTLEVSARISNGNAVPVSFAGGVYTININKPDNYYISYKFNCGTQSTSAGEIITSGDVVAPTISVGNMASTYVWEGETIRVDLTGVSAKDKFGQNVENVIVKVVDALGHNLEVKSDASGNRYVEIGSAGIYKVQYTATDEDGFTAIETISLTVHYPQEEEGNKISAGKIVGIVIGSIIGIGAIGFVIFLIIKSNKEKNKFISKSKQAKKETKSSKSASEVYTVAESKDGKTWVAKRGSKIISKFSSKEEAVEKIGQVGGQNSKKIKVYNKSGRLIDSIDD